MSLQAMDERGYAANFEIEKPDEIIHVSLKRRVVHDPAVFNHECTIINSNIPKPENFSSEIELQPLMTQRVVMRRADVDFCDKLLRDNHYPSEIYFDLKDIGLFFEDGRLTPQFTIEAEHVLQCLLEKLRAGDDVSVIKRICYKTIYGFNLLFLDLRWFTANKIEGMDMMQFARRILELRARLSHRFVAQTNCEEQSGNSTWIGNVMTSIKNFFTGMRERTVECVDKFIKFLVEKVFGLISSVLEILGLNGRIITMLGNAMHGMCQRILAPLAALREKLTTTIMVGIGSLTFLLLLYGLGWLTYQLTVSAISSLIGRNVTQIYITNNTTPMTAQGPESIGLLIGGLMSILQISDSKNISDWAKRTTATVAACLVGGKFLATVFGLFPEALRRMVLIKLGGKKAEAMLDYQDWKDDATMLLSLSKIAKVVCSPVYLDRVKTSMTRARELERRLPRDLFPMFLNLYSRMTTLHATVTSILERSARRPAPYAFHIWGKSGVGKSTVAESLLAALGYTSNDVFYRDGSKEFWDGFLPSHKVVVYDEFLVNCDPDVGPEYLSLVSPTPYAPPMASLDNLSVGMKGTRAQPDVVMTMCNTPTPRSNAALSEAMDRRRRRVIEVDIADEYQKQYTNNNIDLGKFTSQERKLFVWMKFRFGPTHERYDREHRSSPWMTYTEMMVKLTDDFKMFMDISRGVATDVDTSTSVLSVEELLETSSHVGQMVTTTFEGGSLGNFLSYLGDMLSNGGRRRRRKGKGADDPGSSYCSPGLKNTQPGSDEEYEDARSTDSGSVTSEQPSLECPIPYTETSSFWTDDPPTYAFAPAKDGFAKLSERDRTKLVRMMRMHLNTHLARNHYLRRHYDTDYTVYNRGEATVYECPGEDKGPCWYQLIDATEHDIATRIMEHFDHLMVSHTFQAIELVTFLSNNPLECEPAYTADVDLGTWMYDPAEMAALLERAGYSASEIWFKGFLAPFKMIGYGFSIALLILSVRNLLRGSEEQTQSVEAARMEAQSNQKMQQNRSKARRPYKAQAGPAIPMVKLAKAGEGTVNGIHIGDKLVLTVSHIFQNIKEGEDINLISGTETYRVKHNPSYLTIDEDYDLAIYNFVAAERFQKRKSILSKFMTEQEIDCVEHLFIAFHGKDTVYTNASVGRVAYVDMESSKSYSMEGVRYRLLGRAGDCGTPITASSGVSAGKILGIHVCSNCDSQNPVSGGSFVTREWLEAASKLTPIDIEEVTMTAQGPEDELTQDQWEQTADLNRSHRRYLMNVFGYTTRFWKRLDASTINMHDMSKFMAVEAKGIYDRFILDQDTEAWKESLKHHYMVNGHHPEYWRGNNMPQKYLEESIVDMMARTWEKSGKALVSMSELADMTNDDRYLARYNDNDRVVVKRILDTIAAKDTRVPRELKEMDAVPDYDICVDHTEGEWPNIVAVQQIPQDEQIHISQHTKLKLSDISPHLDFPYKKTDPLLRADDPRAEGVDPVARGITTTWDAPGKTVAIEELEPIADDMFHYYDNKLTWPAGKRELTFEEAVLGIPGVLKSIDLNTSPGYPLVKNRAGKGKRPYVNIVDGKLEVAPGFKDIVMTAKENIEKKDYKNKHVWLGFVKDELTNKMKLNLKKTRLIYCGNLIDSLVFRMKYGCLLAAFNHAHDNTPSAIGLNQYSADMNVIKNYLDEVDGPGYIAGDGRDFDKLTNGHVQKLVYLRVIGRLAEKHLGTTEIDSMNFYIHECKSPMQIGPVRFWTRANHASGNFYTTIANNLNHEFYWRYSFSKLCPNLDPNQHIRMKFMGDDNIIKLSHQAAQTMDAVKYAEFIKCLGQIYTSDVKDQELTDEFRPFDKISFLGAIPRIGLDGFWIGALKKDTIMETVHWTRDDSASLDQVTTQMMEHASLHDQEFYEYFVDQIQKAYRKIGREPPVALGYATQHKLVASRTAASGLSFNVNMVAQGPARRDETGFRQGRGGLHIGQDKNDRELEEALVSAGNLTEVQASDGDVKMDIVEPITLEKPHNDGIGERKYETKTLVESYVERTSFTWNHQQPVGDVIGSIPLPFGLLALGAQDTPQNKQFSSYIYWRGSIWIILQLNGNEFQAGLLNVYFRPGVPDNRPGQYNCCTTFDTMKLISPNTGSIYLLRIPYRHWKSWLSTYNSESEYESLGTLFFRVISPLRSNGSDSVTITVFGGFPGSVFKLPRPVGSQRKVPGQRYLQTRDGGETVTYMVAQGGGQSTTVVNNTYSIDNVVGDVTLEGPSTVEGGQASGAEVEASVDAEIPMPMDKPGIYSGAVPVRDTFHGMSRSNGLEYAVSMQLHPTAQTRSFISDFNDSKDFTRFDNLCGARCIRANHVIDKQDAKGAKVFDFDLAGAFVSLPPKQHDATIQEVIQDRFFFWEADIEFTFVAVKTKYHKFRLEAVAGYGLDQSPTLAESRSLKSVVIDFTKENTQTTILVPYNATTGQRMSYPGARVMPDRSDATIGNLTVFLIQPLNCPSTVAQEVDIVCFYRLLRPKFSVPRALGYVGPINPEYAPGESAPVQVTNGAPDVMVAQGPAPVNAPPPVSETGATPLPALPDDTKEAIQPDPEPVRTEEVEVDQEPTQIQMTFRDEKKPTRPAKLNRGAQFEYCPSSWIEIMRRHYQITVQKYLKLDVAWPIHEAQGQMEHNTMLYFKNKPYHRAVRLYWGWKGSLKYRIIMQGPFETYPIVTYQPDGNVPVTSNDFIGTNVDFTTMSYEDDGAKVTLTNMMENGVRPVFPLMAIENVKMDGDYFVFDLNIPYQSIYNFLGVDSPTGTIRIFYALADGVETKVAIYQAVGDDFMMGGWQGPDSVRTTVFDRPPARAVCGIFP